ncbi:MAG: hypothetical protein M1831_000020 [Alyxoria varia]|nr:MAG: hypothetical protein M1831_000020 [Alyxoria varia]
MAHAQRMSALTDELVEAITSYSPIENVQAFKSCKDLAYKSLRYHRYGRTNQFTVTSSFSGLVEKLQIVDREEVADALDVRVAELKKETAAKRWKWTPEVLSLLLNLSDRPAEKSRLGDLDMLEHLQVKEEAELTWEDILRGEEGYNGKEWEDVHDRGASSSEEDDDLVVSEESRSDGTGSTDQSLAGAHDERSFLESIIMKPDHSKLRQLQEAQAWRTHPSSRTTTLTELEVIRESLHTLRDLPSPIFLQHPQQFSRLTPNPNYQVEGISPNTYRSILSRLAQTSSRLSELRLFAAQHTSRPLLQRFYSRVTQILSDFDRHLAALESRLVGLTTPVVVSLLSVETEISELASLPLRMWEIVSKLEDGERLYGRPYTLLEEVYDQVCTSQAIGDTEKYKQLADVFFECLETYLKPMVQWMETGELERGTLRNDGESSNEEDEGDGDEDFPIEIREGHIQLATFWRDRFVLKRSDDGEVLAPKFLRHAMDIVFSSGKTVAFMRELGITPDIPTSSSKKEQKLSLDSILQHSPFHVSTTDDLIPFSELLHLSLDNLLSSKQQHTPQLRDHLLHTTGLRRTLQALQTLYLSANGSLFNAFADELFLRVDQSSPSLTNRFMLEDLARSVFCADSGRDSSIDPDNISVSVSGGEKSQQSKPGAMPNDITLIYTIPRSLSNILNPRSTLPVYQKISTFLLRLRRASTLLTRDVLRPSASASISTSPTTTKTPLLQQNHTLHTLTLRLRHILLHTVTTLQSHVLCCVLHPAWLRFSHQLNDDGKAQTMDDMIGLHEGFARFIRCATLFHGLGNHGTDGSSERQKKRADASTTVQQCFEAVFRGCDNFAAVAVTVTNSEKPENVELEHQKAKRLRQLVYQHARVVAVLAGELRGMSRGGREVDSHDAGVDDVVAGAGGAQDIAGKRRKRDELGVRESWGELAEKLMPGEG